MLLDGRNQIHGTHLTTDICVVGAGAAGITLAHELNRSGRDVLLLETGGFDLNHELQELNKGRYAILDEDKPPYLPDINLHQDNYVSFTRMRFFGGSTNHWGGWCRPLDELDFTAREWIPHSGWPLRKADLEPYYRVAEDLCDIPAFDYDVNTQSPSERKAVPFSPLFESHTYHFSPPTRFGTKFRNELMVSDNVKLLMFTTLKEIELSPNAQSVHTLKVQSAQEFTITAKQVVLAMGTIETCRTLLASNRQVPQGIGNQQDLVGRFYMEHPHIKTAIVVISEQADQVNWSYLYNLDPALKVHTKLAYVATRETQQKYRLGNHSLKIMPYEILESNQHSLDAFVRQVAPQLDHAGKVDVRKARLFDINIHGDPIPQSESRITLLDEKDAFGVPRVDVKWKLSQEDKRNISQTMQLFSTELGRQSKGRLKNFIHPDQQWPDDLYGGFHQMGGTRMSESPKSGVVDANLKVHGLDNLFIASSSVFPNAGNANPTLTIVALAARLAEHLKSQRG